MELKTCNDPHYKIAYAIAEAVIYQLEKEKEVLLLTAGGRAHKVYEELGNALDGNNLEKLTVSFGDEHWSKNKDDSETSWTSFKHIPVWDAITRNGGRIYDIIQGDGIESDAEKFDAFLTSHIKEDSHIISWQGMGTDGHTAGILPADLETFSKTYLVEKYAISHDKGGETPLRVTITPKFIEEVDQAFIYAIGEDKLHTIMTLMDLADDYPGHVWESNLHKYPALYLSLTDTTFFTDQDIIF